MTRYAGKPFLRLLDSYVLDAIGQLTDEQRSGLERLEPRLASLYETSDSWQEIVRKKLDLPESFPASVQQVWIGFLEAARSQSIPVDPGDFVKRFVDENFPEAL